MAGRAAQTTAGPPARAGAQLVPVPASQSGTGPTGHRAANSPSACALSSRRAASGLGARERRRDEPGGDAPEQTGRIPTAVSARGRGGSERELDVGERLERLGGGVERNVRHGLNERREPGVVALELGGGFVLAPVLIRRRPSLPSAAGRSCAASGAVRRGPGGGRRPSYLPCPRRGPGRAGRPSRARRRSAASRGPRPRRRRRRPSPRAGWARRPGSGCPCFSGCHDRT